MAKVQLAPPKKFIYKIYGSRANSRIEHFKANVPESIDKSFYRGKMFAILNDSVFEGSSPIRHSAVTMVIEYPNFF